mgnify:FL=1
MMVVFELGYTAVTQSSSLTQSTASITSANFVIATSAGKSSSSSKLVTEHGFAAQSKGSSNAQSDVITRAPSVSVAGVLVGSSKSSCAAAAIFVASGGNE